MENYTGVLIVLTILVVLLILVAVVNLLCTCCMLSSFKKNNKRNRIEIIRRYNNITDVLRELNNFVLDYQSEKKIRNINDIIEYPFSKKEYLDIEVPKVSYSSEREDNNV